ncbi:hypothetical protein [Erwinia aphidicola]|uniref:hypothetical protein n=1 Tax=Erwinia aphidicola TaxID=68334 RepID=UPI003CE712F4
MTLFALTEQVIKKRRQRTVLHFITENLLSCLGSFFPVFDADGAAVDGPGDTLSIIITRQCTFNTIHYFFGLMSFPPNSSSVAWPSNSFWHFSLILSSPSEASKTTFLFFLISQSPGNESAKQLR